MGRRNTDKLRRIDRDSNNSQVNQLLSIIMCIFANNTKVFYLLKYINYIIFSLELMYTIYICFFFYSINKKLFL